VNLTVIGFGQKELKKLSPELHEEFKDIIDKIEFRGYLSWGEEFRIICQQSMALILPSISEGTPRVILEAMSQGCPVIASNVGGIPTIIKNEVNGLLFEVGDFYDLKNCIEKLIVNKNGLKEELIENGLKTAQTNTIGNFGSHFLKMIQKYE